MAGQALPVVPDIDDPLTVAARYAAFARRRDDGAYELELMVRGLHCAACIQKVESCAREQAGVQDARLNFSTGRLRLTWDGVPDTAAHIVHALTQSGYEVSAYDPVKLSEDGERERRFLLLCTGVAGFAAGNIMLLSFALWSTTIETMGLATRDFIHWISALIAVPAVAFSGRPFFRSAWSALRQGQTNMEVPISIALILATAMSLFQLYTHAEDTYFDSAVMLMFFLLVGRYMDFQARTRARGAAGDLLAMMGGVATVADGDDVRVVPVSALREGMTAYVAMGERIPADGVVTGGRSDVDFSLVTGESLPQAVMEGAKVTSGALNISAPLTVRIDRKADDSFLADVVRLMEKAEQGQSRYVRLADRVARLYAPVVHILALAGFLFWFFVMGAGWQDALLIAVTVLIITCPCALGLAVPVVQVLAVEQLMRRGVMVKAGDALERLATVDMVFLDKTGTLTHGRPVLEGMVGATDRDFALAASMAVHSRHPLSRALAAAYDGAVVPLVVREYPGQGLEADIQGTVIRLGRAAWCGVADDASGGLNDGHDGLRVYFRYGDIPPAVFTFGDALRPDAVAAVAALKARGLRVALLSGDRESAVAYAASQAGIDEYRAATTPADKVAAVESACADRHRVLMVGDGLNDAPVLAAADVSMSPSTAIELSQNAADVVFTGSALGGIVVAHDAALLTRTLVKQNFMLSIGYNVVAIPLAFAGMVDPLVAALAMSLSSLLVIFNSFRLQGRI